MLLTLFLTVVFCAAMALMLLSSVLLIQENKFFSSAPEEVKKLLVPRDQEPLSLGQAENLETAARHDAFMGRPAQEIQQLIGSVLFPMRMGGAGNRAGAAMFLGHLFLL